MNPLDKLPLPLVFRWEFSGGAGGVWRRSSRVEDQQLRRGREKVAVMSSCVLCGEDHTSRVCGGVELCSERDAAVAQSAM